MFDINLIIDLRFTYLEKEVLSHFNLFPVNLLFLNRILHLFWKESKKRSEEVEALDFDCFSFLLIKASILSIFCHMWGRSMLKVSAPTKHIYWASTLSGLQTNFETAGADWIHFDIKALKIILRIFLFENS